MLNDSLIAVKRKLQQNLQNRYSLDDDIVVLNQLVEQDGSGQQQNKNKIVITLLNLSQETTKQYINSNKKQLDSTFIKTNPALTFNLYVLFTACFDDYEETLKFLNSTIAFFQANQSVSLSSSQAGTEQFNTLRFEIENASHHEMHNLWSAMGAKYRPSILYKVRYVTIQSDELQKIVPQVDGTDVKAAV
jgi:hypothetical protein